MRVLRQLTRKIAQIEARIDALSLRERLLSGVTAVALVVAVWFLAIHEPLSAEGERKLNELMEVSARIATANEGLNQQLEALAGGDAEQRSQLARLEIEIGRVNARLGEFADELVDPAEMTRVLESVLREQSLLDLVRIRNLPSSSIAASDEEDASRFFRHGIEIVIEGSYADCIDYLKEIEALPWRLYWQLYELDVIEYPNNRMRIEVGTLSLDEEWIGA